ncbi:hypothetical protein [Streptomyces catenulae]|uniref:HAD family phosphatase n=1 Tax=Streptomyces catenulae TaxID=66875 RepID=A0ABV2YZH7_9ACTN|nr:hypothetical protein [Streptomyces catenulae]
MTGAADHRIGTVLLDVNGTLVPSVPRRGAPAPETSGAFRHAVREVRAAGIRVGLCSDSPVEQLREFGRAIGLGPPATFPVLAENGNVVAGERIRVLTPFPGRDAVRAQVAECADRHGLRHGGELRAPEFGGTPLPPGAWGLGANRRASLSVFGPVPFVAAVERHLTRWAARNSVTLAVEPSPARTYAGIHPYAPIRLGKRRALAGLAAEGLRDVLLVGDSPADWIPGVPGVRSAFVAGAALPAEAEAGAWHRSREPELAGVLDILRRVAAAERAAQ